MHMFGETTAEVAVRLCAALKLTEQIKLLEVEGARALVSIAGDAKVVWFRVKIKLELF